MYTYTPPPPVYAPPPSRENDKGEAWEVFFFVLCTPIHTHTHIYTLSMYSCIYMCK